MIGGIVTEVIVLPDRVWVECVERQGYQKCAIYMNRTAKSLNVEPGDSLWWQGCWALWTPFSNKKMPDAKCGKHYDIRIERLGGSGVERPTL